MVCRITTDNLQREGEIQLDDPPKSRSVCFCRELEFCQERFFFYKALSLCSPLRKSKDECFIDEITKEVPTFVEHDRVFDIEFYIIGEDSLDFEKL